MSDRFGVGGGIAPAPDHAAGPCDTAGLIARHAGMATRCACTCVALGALLATQACGHGTAGTPSDTARAAATASSPAPGAAVDSAAPAASAVSAATADVTPANAGFAGPENIVYDSVADVYLVS